MAQRIRDIDIRRELMNTELRHFIRDPQTRIIEELGVFYGTNRIDIAAVNGALHGFEIKSEADDLTRLPDQAAAYNQVFDHLTLIAYETHLPEAQMMPEIDHWRILIAERGQGTKPVKLRTFRDGAENSSVSPRALARLLWKDESLEILRTIGADRGIRSKPRHAVADRLAESMPLGELQRVVRETLKHREGWRADSSQA